VRVPKKANEPENKKKSEI
jgi:hypothetical protein